MLIPLLSKRGGVNSIDLLEFSACAKRQIGKNKNNERIFDRLRFKLLTHINDTNINTKASDKEAFVLTNLN